MKFIILKYILYLNFHLIYNFLIYMFLIVLILFIFWK